MADTWFRFYNTAVDHPKTLRLNDTQFRAWVRLMSLASKLGGSFPDDMTDISLAVRKSPQKAAELVQVLLSAKLLDRTEGGYTPHNWNEKQFKSDVSTERVKRFRDRQRNAVSETDQRQRHSQIQKDNTSAPAGRFHEFWLGYPRKVGKGAAEKAWAKASKITEPETILDRLKAYSASVAKEDPKFIPHPSTWLNEKRWEDDGLAPATPTHSPEELEALKDRTDRILKRGKYAEMML